MVLGLGRPSALLAVLLGLAGSLTGQPSAGELVRRPFSVLQVNLCNSGMATCYSGGRAVARAVELVREVRPDVMTLDEICRADLTAVRRAVQRLDRDRAVVSTFRAAGDRPSSGPTRCLNGQDFGIGLVVSVPAPYRGQVTSWGTYSAQDPSDPELRVWACITATRQFRACATHLAAIGGAVALAQCRELMSAAAGPGPGRPGHLPLVLGGDLNLGLRPAADVRTCVPPGYARNDDGDVQHVITSGDLEVRQRRLVDVRGTTDHPGLLVGGTLTRILS